MTVILWLSQNNSISTVFSLLIRGILKTDFFLQRISYELITVPLYNPRDWNNPFDILTCEINKKLRDSLMQKCQKVSSRTQLAKRGKEVFSINSYKSIVLKPLIKAKEGKKFIGVIFSLSLVILNHFLDCRFFKNTNVYKFFAQKLVF